MDSAKESIASLPGVAARPGASDWTWELTQLEHGGARSGTVARVSAGVLVGNARLDHVSLHRIKAPAGYACLMIAGDAGALFVGGHRVLPAECVVVPSNTEIEAVTHRMTEVVSIAASEPLWAEDARRLWCRGVPLGQGAYLARCEPRATAVLHMRIKGALHSCARTADASSRSAPRQAVAESLLDQLGRLADAPLLSHRQRRAPNRRHAGVEVARQYIREHLADPIRLSDLCLQAHLRPRSLEYGFREILCLSPMSYLKALRLNTVHRQLTSTMLAQRSISEIALDTGFRHLSQFAVDYKRLFGESPSTTRRRIANGLPAAPMHRFPPSSDGSVRRVRIAQADSLVWS